MRTLPGLILLAFLIPVRPVAAEDGFVALFNGRDLDGWVNVNCAPNTWTATNGLIYCTGVPIGELRTARMYQNFVLELEWRHLKPQGNAGVFVWADALTARGQPFIRGIEVQVLDGREGPGYTSDGDIFPIHGAKMVPVNGRGGDRAFPTEKRMKPSPEWNQYRIECVDGSISLAVNGKVVTRGHDASPRKGYVCLESEGSPAEFRNLRLKELPVAAALAPGDIANPDEGFVSLYNGLDLAGWEAPGATPPAWQVKDWILSSPAKAGSAPLRSTASFGDGILVFDWRWTDEKRPGDWARLVRLRDRDLRDVLAPFAQAASSAELAPGKWNRALVRCRGNEIAVEMNGRSLGAGPIAIPGIAPAGPIQLLPPTAPVDVANLFWKRLD